MQQDGFPELFPGKNMGGMFTNGTARIRFRDHRLSNLVEQFSFALATRLIDKTRLTGRYDFTLEFTPPETGGIVGRLATLLLNPGQVAPLMSGPNPGQLDSFVDGFVGDGAAARAEAAINGGVINLICPVTALALVVFIVWAVLNEI